jgi:hypothetical protein
LNSVGAFHLQNICRKKSHPSGEGSISFTGSLTSSRRSLPGRRWNLPANFAGDSFNDTAMLLEANAGFLIHAPEKVKQEFPQFKAVESHAELLKLIKKAMA